MIGIDEKRRNEWKQNEGFIMKSDDTTEHVRTKSQKKNSKWMKMMKWNGMRGLERKWIGVSVNEVAERKNGMGMDGNEWIENIDANENEKQGWVVMKVMEVK